MTPKGQAIQSFQENQKFISAINTLSIHIKLKMAGHSDLNRKEAIPGARGKLYLIFDRIEFSSAMR